MSLGLICLCRLLPPLHSRSARRRQKKVVVVVGGDEARLFTSAYGFARSRERGSDAISPAAFPSPSCFPTASSSSSASSSSFISSSSTSTFASSLKSTPERKEKEREGKPGGSLPRRLSLLLDLRCLQISQTGSTMVRFLGRVPLLSARVERRSFNLLAPDADLARENEGGTVEDVGRRGANFAR